MHSICNVATNSANLIKRYSDVFKGLGCLGDEYHIELDPTVSPVQHVPRRVPVAMKHRLKSKLEELTKQGIITKVQEPTPWISNIVKIMKPGKVRVCIDPRDLNKAIKRPKYQMPTVEEILPTLAQAKIFTVLDAKDGFHQVKLDEASLPSGPPLDAFITYVCHLEYHQHLKNFSVACTQPYKGFQEWR